MFVVYGCLYYYLVYVVIYKCLQLNFIMIPNPFLVMPLSDFVKAGRKIVGAGLNYFALLAEKNLPKPSQPVLFLKPTSSYITEGHDIKIPPGFLIKEEVELGVIIGTKCRNVSPDSAMSYVGGYCLALDMTEVNLMDEVKKKGLPWTFAKGFDTACPVSRFLSPEELGDPHDVRIWSRVNGKQVQDASTSDLVFRVPQLIAAITRYITLEPGDLVLTGSPPGHTPVRDGDVVEAGVADILRMKFPVRADK